MIAKDEAQPSGSSASPINPRSVLVRRVVGIVCLLLALLFYYGSVLRMDFQQTNFLDLGPYPDAVEYFAQANAILSHGAPTIQIANDRLPSRYPPGYPVLMIPWLECLHHNKILAPFRTNQTIGLLLLLGVFSFYCKDGRPMAGGIATLLLASQPAFVTYTRASMSDLSGAAAAALAFALIYLGLKWRRRRFIYGAAIILGLSLSIRPQLVFFAPLLISMALFPTNKARGRWFIHCFLVLLTFVLAASPYFILNAIEFGNPLKTGYDFWVPSLTDKQMPFALHNVPGQVSMLWSEATATWDQFKVANLFGSGTYFVPAFVLLTLAGLGFCKPNRFTFSAFLAGASFCLATITYSFIDPRFYMPVQFLCVALATLPVAWALEEGSCSRPLFWRIAILALFVLTCVGYPSESDFKPKKGRFQVWDALTYPDRHDRSPRYAATRHFVRGFKNQPGIILSNIDPVYLNTLLPKGFVAAPVDATHSYSYSRLWHFGTPEATALAKNGLSKNEPVYALLSYPGRPEQVSQRLPRIGGYSWKPSAQSGGDFMVMILKPNIANTTEPTRFPASNLLMR